MTRYRDIAPGRHHSVPKRLVQLDGIYWERLRLVLCVEVAFAQVACAHAHTHTSCTAEFGPGRVKVESGSHSEQVFYRYKVKLVFAKNALGLPKTPLLPV